MTSAEAMAEVRESFAVAGGALSLALSRQIDTLGDPRPGKGEPVPIEASGAHLIGATTLAIAPQDTWIFRGGVESGTPVAVAGHATAYATTAKATVDDTSPDTLALTITPGLEAALDGAEVVTLTEASSVSYSCRKVSDTRAASRGWQVPRGSGVYLVDHEGKRTPKIGDNASGAHTGSVLNIEGQPFPYSILQIGGLS